MSDRRPAPPELHLVLGEGHDPADDGDDGSSPDQPALRLVAGFTLPDDLR